MRILGAPQNIFNSLVYLTLILVLGTISVRQFKANSDDAGMIFPEVPAGSCVNRQDICFSSALEPSSEFYRSRIEIAGHRLARQKRLREAIEAGRQFPSNAFVFDVFVPVISCAASERVGRFGDGGKWVCDPQKLPSPCTVFSVGGSTDLSFEVDMHDRYGCETHTFDPSPGLMERMLPQLKPGMHYHAIGLGPTTTDPNAADPYELVISKQKVPTKSLAALASEAGTERVDLLKIDIEGSEWGAIPQLVTEGTLDRLGTMQVLVEFHWPEYKEMAKVFDLLIAHGFLPFSRESNTFDVRCSEYSFVKRDYLVR